MGQINGERLRKELRIRRRDAMKRAKESAFWAGAAFAYKCLQQFYEWEDDNPEEAK